ncbi:hypothetical protein [Nitrosopumilus sp.]|uniref:GAP1-N2 domain-containing protein n=1 Tax=Nitrosopumilus sp. TaxID=2024843 RepID=UPI003D109782
MHKCDQLFYTTASVGNKSGYQVTAKSSGITEDVIQDLEGYLYPVGIDPSKFSSSNSLLFLKNNKVAFSTVINIGTGFDGRDNTLYNHTIILEKHQFEKMNFDSRILFQYFIEDPKELGVLDKIQIHEMSIPINWDFFESIPRNLLETILDALFSSKKISLIGIKNAKFIPELLTILPKSMRLLSYSNVVAEPKRQNLYDISQIKNDDKFSVEENHLKINSDEMPVFYENNDDLILERTVKIIVEIIKNKDQKSLDFIHNEFEEIDNSNIKNKIKLVTYYNEVEKSHDEYRTKKFANDILEILKDFDDDTTVNYLLKIKPFLPENDFKKYSKGLELSYIVSKFDDTNLDFNTVYEMFNSLHDWTYESRDQLFKNILKTNFQKIKKNGTKLLLDARFQFEEVILDNFIQNPQLHENILELFDEKTDLPIYYKKSYLEHIIERISKMNNFLTIELLKKPIFNLDDEYDSKHYRKILKLILSNDEFLKKTTPESLLDLIHTIFFRIKQIIEHDMSSDVNTTTNSNLHELTKIIKRFLKSLEYLEKTELDLKLRDKLLLQKDEMTIFLEKHKPKRTLSNLFD